MRTLRYVFASALVVLMAILSVNMSSNSQNAPARSRALAADPPAELVLKDTGDIKWGSRPPDGLPGPAQVAVLSGDWRKDGATFALAAQLPGGYTIAPHWYLTDVSIVVTSGALMVGTGDTPVESSMKTIGVGGYAFIPMETHHSIKAKGETRIIISGRGPFEIRYANPSDDRQHR